MIPIEITHLAKRYGSDIAVDDLSFTVQPGRITGFLGPNGSGKSTTMKVLLDLARANAGSATIGGRRYRELRDPVGTVGVVLEPNAFHPGRSGRNHLRVLGDACGVGPARIAELLDLVGLSKAADRRVGGYSLGMRQRLGLAVALLRDPPVLVLDEPGNGLDPQGLRWLRDLLRSRAVAGSTLLVSSHMLAEIENLADDVVVIDHGRLVTSGALADLEQAGVTLRTPHPAALAELLASAGATTTVKEDGALLARGLSAAAIGDRACAAGIPLHELAPSAGSLEDLFLSWTESSPMQRIPAEEAVPV